MHSLREVSRLAGVSQRSARLTWGAYSLKVPGPPPERHNPPRGSLRKFASQMVLRGLWEGSLAGVHGIFPRVVTLSL